MYNYLKYKEVSEKKGWSISKLERELGLSNGSIKKAIERESPIKSKTLEKIMEICPECFSDSEISQNIIEKSQDNIKITSMPQSEKDYQQLYYDELTKRADMQDRLLAQQDKLMQIQELFYTKYHEMKTELTHVSTAIKEVSLSSGNCLNAVVFLGASLNGFRDFSVDCFEKVLHLTPGELKGAADKAFLSSLQTNESKGTPQEQGSLSKA